jgi:putative transposase
MLKMGLARVGRTKVCLNSMLHGVCGDHGRPVVFLLFDGQMSGYKGVVLTLGALPVTKQLLADHCVKSGGYREARRVKDTVPCVLACKNQKLPLDYDTMPYRQRHRIEYMFAKLQDWAASPLATIDASTSSCQP